MKPSVWIAEIFCAAATAAKINVDAGWKKPRE
jgi:hypothetical protein